MIRHIPRCSGLKIASLSYNIDYVNLWSAFGAFSACVAFRVKCHLTAWPVCGRRVVEQICHFQHQIKLPAIYGSVIMTQGRCTRQAHYWV
jgi:hypothetical protein